MKRLHRKKQVIDKAADRRGMNAEAAATTRIAVMFGMGLRGIWLNQVEK